MRQKSIIPHFTLLFLLLLSLFFSTCDSPVVVDVVRKDPRKLSAKTEKGVHAVIEIPAGTNKKIEYDKEANRFLPDQIDGKDRIIQFLPYPANYGFIPSTYMDPIQGGDGDPLDVLVIAPYQRTSTIMEVRPIAALLLRDDNELDTKIIAVPLDSAKQVLPVETYPDLAVEYQAVLRIIETWFLNYKGSGRTELVGWKDEGYAWQEIEKWEVKVEQE